MCGRLAYMELAWIGDALLGPSKRDYCVTVFSNFGSSGLKIATL